LITKGWGRGVTLNLYIYIGRQIRTNYDKHVKRWIMGQFLNKLKYVKYGEYIDFPILFIYLSFLPTYSLLVGFINDINIETF